MDPTVELQKQIKDNAEDVRRFVSELSSWEEEMKRKESETRTGKVKESSAPPIRNSSMKRESTDTSHAHTSGESQGVKKRISSSDYAAWEKFDVEKACEEVDDPANKRSSETEDEIKVKEKRLRDQANCEKEKGNQFVKKEKWDGAIECYSKAIQCYPRDAIFYCNRALCFLKKKNYRAAETDCTSALALDSSYVKALHRRGLARKELNQLEEAALDLQRASEIEPNNTAISRDLQAVCTKLEQSSRRNNVERTRVETEVILTETEVTVDLGVEKKSDPILPAKKHRPSCSSQKEPTDKKQAASSLVWPKLDDSTPVEPIFIPPHKRSKKPLQRIHIQDECHIAPANTTGETFPQAKLSTEESKTCDGKKIEEITTPCTITSSSVTPKISKKLEGAVSIKMPPITCSMINTVPNAVPPAPKNSVQFIAGWRQIYKDSKMCQQYLKQINGEDLPKIFQDSLDGNIFSQILNVLAGEFVPANDPVLSYLQGLTRVPRFRTLTLFLSRQDKENLHILLKHAQTLEQASTDVMALKKEYEI